MWYLFNHYWERPTTNSFIRVWSDAVVCVLEYGRIGAEPSTRQLDILEADQYLEQRAVSLLRRGYWYGRHKLAFIEQIHLAPTDMRVREVYADWLLEEQDARGELIAIQVAMRNDPDDQSLARRQSEILKAHSHQFLGGWGGTWNATVEWELGFARTVRFTKSTYPLTGPQNMLGRLRHLCFHPTGHFVQRLEIAPPSERAGLSGLSRRWWQELEASLPRALENLVENGRVARNLVEVVLESPVPRHVGVRQLAVGTRRIRLEVRQS